MPHNFVDINSFKVTFDYKNFVSSVYDPCVQKVVNTYHQYDLETDQEFYDRVVEMVKNL
jgi:hypothetical protein